jgi:methyltransferase-like protein
LAICRQRLAPNGVAYISYNTYPGWRQLAIIRELMQFHTRRVTGPARRAAEAKAALHFLVRSISTKNNPTGQMLQPYLAFLQKYEEMWGDQADGFLLHDELAEINDPIYFYQFIERAGGHGLQYLAEAELRANLLVTSLPAEVVKNLQEMAADLIELEQYLDFLYNRTFRQTLLCHADVRLNRRLRPELLANLYVTSRAEPVSPEPELQSAVAAQFRSFDGTVLSTAHPLSKAAMRCLIELWPGGVAFETLVKMAGERLGIQEANPEDVEKLAANLLNACGRSTRLAGLYVHAPDVATEISARPIASPVARFKAGETSQTTNLYHERVHLTALEGHLLRQLDGSHDRADLLKALVELAVAGSLPVEQDGRPVTEAGQLRDVLAGQLESNLDRLQRAALLVG